MIKSSKLYTPLVQMRVVVVAIQKWYRIVKKKRENRQEILLRTCHDGIVAKPGMILNWIPRGTDSWSEGTQQVQIIGFAQLDTDAVNKAARKLWNKLQKHYWENYYDNSCFSEQHYWHGKVVSKELMWAHLHAPKSDLGSIDSDDDSIDSNKDTHVVVRVLSENVFRFVPKLDIGVNKKLQNWRTRVADPPIVDSFCSTV